MVWARSRGSRGGLAGEHWRWSARVALVALASSEVLENASDDDGVGDHADHAQLCAAQWTHRDIDAEHPVQSGHPRQRCRGWPGGGRIVLGAGARAVLGHDETAVAGVGGDKIVGSDFEQP